MTEIRLLPALLALSQTPAETILLAHLCTQAAAASSFCGESNQELAQAVGMHPKTVSDLLHRLKAAGLLKIKFDNRQGNQRRLLPSAELLAAYQPPNVGKPTTSRSNSVKEGSVNPTGKRGVSRPFRVCPISGLDISRQRADVRLANRTTLLKLASQNQPVFDILSARLLPATLLSESVAVRSHQLARTIRQRAANYLHS